ncbi:nitroreductase family protein [Chlamydiota bacterium]
MEKNDYFQNLIKMRRSVRKYTEAPVSIDAVLTCVEAARMAPSACNIQPWHFIVVNEPELKKVLYKKAFSGILGINSFVATASIFIVVVTKRDIITNRIAAGMKRIPYYLLDIGAACQQLLLQATELGIGSCWLGWFKEKPIKRCLSIPAGKKVVSIIALGIPSESLEEAKEKKRKELNEIVSFNKY